MLFYEEYEEPEKYHKCSHNGFMYPESEMTLLVLCKNVSSWVANENLNQYKLNNYENRNTNKKRMAGSCRSTTRNHLESKSNH